MPFCENCGSPITGNVCQRCGWNATQLVQQSQPHQQDPHPRRRLRAPIVSGVLIIVATIVLALLLISITPPPPPFTNPSPKGELNFTETSPGNYTGGIIWLSDEVKLSQAIITINDVSNASVASQGPPLLSGVPITTPGGLSLTFTDTNSNNRMDPEDVWTISNGAEGDQIIWLHDTTGRTIARYIVP